MRKIFAVILAIASAASVFGQDTRNGSSGMHVSSLGYGAHGQYLMGDRFALRLLANHYVGSEIRDLRGNRYDGRLTLNSVGGVFDWKLGAGFYLSLGAFYNGNRVDAVAIGMVQPDLITEYAKTSPLAKGHVALGATELNSKQYDNMTLRAELHYNPIAPYLGFGWNSLNDGAPLAFFADLGVWFHDTPKLDFFGQSDSCKRFFLEEDRVDVCDGLQPLQDDLTIEYREVRRDIDIKYLPVLTIGISYAF